MDFRNPNRPMPGASHPEAEPRHNGPAGRGGDAAHDGYTVIGRRPRVSFRGFDEVVPAEEADRIEDTFGDMGHMRPFPY